MDIKEKIYFDNAATTPILEEVINEMIPFMQNAYGNPSSTHSFGRESKAAVEMARKRIAKELHCNASELIFTSGGTEANNLAFHIAVKELKLDSIITAKTEHKAVLKTAEKYSDEVKVLYVKTDSEGRIDFKDLESLIIAYPNCLLSLMFANNEIATLLDIKKLNKLLEKHPVYFHTDAVQYVGHYRLDLSTLKHITFLSASAHKFHGPKGVGFLYIKRGTPVNAQLRGGSQERELRAGTENVSGIVGMHKAFDLAYRDLVMRKETIRSLKEYLKTSLIAEFPHLKINGAQDDESLYSILNVSFPSHKSHEMLPFALDLKGIAVSAGSACSSGSTSFSHVLKAIGTRDDWPAIRFSFSHFNTKEEIDRLIVELRDIL